MSEIELCEDCKQKPATRTYGLGHKRCEYCAGRFDEKNHQERYKLESAVHTCGECNETFIGQYECPHCCDHEPDADEGYHCLNCGTDCSEGVMSLAYDMAKDVRKYGG